MKNLFLYLLLSCSAILCLSACDASNMSAGNSERSRTPMNTSGSTANAASNVGNPVSGADRETAAANAEVFMSDAAQAGMAEVEMGKIAQQKSQNPEVRKFAQMMVTEHTAAGKELASLAARKNITLPKDVGPHRSTMDSLGKESAADFDKAYVDLMVSEHEADVKAFQEQAENAADADVKAFAAKTLPTLKKHLELIKVIHAKIN